MPPSRTLVFVNTRKEADYLDDYLYNRGMPTTSIHSDRTQREREDAIRAFKSGKAPVLIASGVTARGMDIKHILHVINYQLPSLDHGGIEEYVHRIGRTARIGNVGLATSFYNDRNEDLAESLVRLLRETNQDIPEFLRDKMPEGELDFNDDTDNEGEEGGGNTGSGWGSGGGGSGGDAWGAGGSGKGKAVDNWGSGGGGGAGDSWGNTGNEASKGGDTWGDGGGGGWGASGDSGNGGTSGWG